MAGGRALQEAQKAEDKRKNRSISHPESLPKLTKKPQPPAHLPAITQKPQPHVRTMPRLTPRPRSQMLSQHPQEPVHKHDYSHSGGRALNATRQSKEHQDHLELVKLARKILTIHREAPSSGLQGDTKTDLDNLTADAYKYSNTYRNTLADASVAHGNYLEAQAEHAKKTENEKYSGSVPKLALGFINMKGPVAGVEQAAASAVGKAAPFVAGAAAPAITSLLAGIDKATGADSLGTAKKIVGNAGKELIDLPANAIPSLYYAGKPAVEGLVAKAGNPNSPQASEGLKETGRRLAEPYVNLAKHPGKTFEEHPISTALMITGPLKAADRVAGRIEQQAIPGMKPKKPYKVVEQKLPGTAAKKIILPRQGALASRLQKKMGGESVTNRIMKGNPTRMPDAEIAKRTDEMFYHSIHQSRQEAYAAIQGAKDAGITDDKVLQQIGKSTLDAHREVFRDLTVKDMALRDKAGRLRTFHFIDGRGGAAQAIEKWGQNMINQGRQAVMTEYEHGGAKGRTYRGARGKDVQTLVPRQLKTGDEKGKYVLMPKIAADQLAQHDSYLAQTPLSAVGQAVGGTFRRTVLPFSPKWLSNNYTEAALRGGLNGVGAMSYKEAKDVFGQLSPAQHAEWNNLVKSVGHGGMQRQLLQEGTTFADRLEHTKYENVGKAITKFGQHPGPKTIAKVFDKYTDVVFSQLNGKMENAVHMGMAGKVLRRNPLMSQKIVDLTAKAMKNPEGAATVESRNNLIALGREVDRMFGKYGKYSPSIRRSVATWTPFIPWSLNAVHFITQHLPNDHPVVTALIADAHQASQEWRNKHGLGYFIDGALPPFLQGGVPGGNGSHWMIFTQGTPFSAAGDPTGTAARGFNPLGSTILNNLSGMDWKGDKFKNPNPIYNTEQAILSLLEATTPIGYASSKLTSGGDSTNENLMKWLNPYHPVKGKQPKGGAKGPFDSKPASSTNDNPFDSGSKKKKSANPFDG